MAKSKVSRRATPAERFWSKFERHPDGCWLWTRCLTKGYGRIAVGGKDCYAHRFAYELLIGPIPEGLTIDHLCMNTRCVNPAHLEPVTTQENTRRAIAALGNEHLREGARKTNASRWKAA